MTPLEKAGCAAISEYQGEPLNWDDLEDDVKKESIAIARAAISSIEVDDAMVEVGLTEALAIMREHGVDGLSPFAAYPSPAETTRRVLTASLRSILDNGAGR